jgi:hypothetical protein
MASSALDAAGGDGAGRVAAEAMEGLVDYYRRISGEHPD